MWPRRRHREDEESIVVASVRLLSGDAIGLFKESRQGVPAWARINLLAHSEVATLARMKAPRRISRANRWDAMVANLAAELLILGHGRPEEVSFLQLAALVPLELALLGGKLPDPLTPGQLGVLVVSALYRAQIRYSQSGG
jgi:hypothetical protein